MHQGLWAMITEETADTMEALSPIGLLHAPMWETAHGAQDWRTYIPLELQAIWTDLDVDARAAMMYLAMRIARRSG